MASRIKYWFSRVFTNVHHKYRMVIMDENFSEKFSFRLSRMHVLMLISMSTISLIGITIILIVFTPIREYIPGYTDGKIAVLAYENMSKTDSLKTLAENQNLMLQILQHAISGDIPLENAENIKDSLKDYRNIQYSKSIEDSLFRMRMEAAQKYNVAALVDSRDIENTSRAQSYSFFVPLQGKIISSFSSQEKQYGIIISGQPNDIIKSVLDGSVILSQWTPTYGYILIIQHENNLLSIYKGNASLLKQGGDFVKAGEAIAFIGNYNSESSLPTLFFELWQNGTPINPSDYILF